MSVSLLREKFIIREAEEGHENLPVIAVGNRMHFKIGNDPSPLIIRTQSMHMGLRIGAEILKQLSFIEKMDNPETFINWSGVWDKLSQPFEKKYVPESWFSVFYQGKSIHQYGEPHPFIDVIEQCDHHNKNQYDQSLNIAQDVFSKMGKTVLIEHESNVGFVQDPMGKDIRFAFIIRLPWQKGTFTARIAPSIDEKGGKRVYDYHGLLLAADFIEALNLSVRTGFLMAKGPKIDKDDRLLLRIGTDRLSTLSKAINQFEARFSIRYRPDKPDFSEIREQCKAQ